MSRIGNNPGVITEGVSVNMEGQNIQVKGSLVVLSQNIDSNISINISDNVLTLQRASEDKDIRAKHGLYRFINC